MQTSGEEEENNQQAFDELKAESEGTIGDLSGTLEDQAIEAGDAQGTLAQLAEDLPEAQAILQTAEAQHAATNKRC